MSWFFLYLGALGFSLSLNYALNAVNPRDDEGNIR